MGPAVSLALHAEQVMEAGGTGSVFSGLEDRQSGQ